MPGKILIHSLVFSPDSVSTAYIYNDIALRFQDEGYEVVVLTTTPHYNLLEEELLKQPLKRKFAGLYYESDFQGIRVIHIPQKKYKRSVFRIMGFIYWHILSFLMGLFEMRVDVILSPSPPLSIGFINIILAKLKGAKVIYNVQEIYPDFLIEHGDLTSRPVIAFLKWLEKFVYNQSDAVTTIDQVFYESILDRFSDPSKLHIIPNFVDTELYKPLSSDSLFIDRNIFPDRPNKLKLMYAGNIGHAQDWDPLIEIAKGLRNYEIDFWVIGEGVKREFLATQIFENNLTNVHLVQYQPRTMMPALISFADLHFIFMSPQMEGQGFPSKVYTIMACAKPLLVISGQETPIYNFLKSADCALLIHEDPSMNRTGLIIDKLKAILSNREILKELGNNGYRFIEDRYSKQSVTRQYVDLVNGLLTNNNEWQK